MTSNGALSNRAFWLQWVVANLLGEFVGLGLVGLIGYAMVAVFGEPNAFFQALAFAIVAVALGALEGSIVGYAQFLVIRRRLPQLRAWVAATILGAVIAWTLGVLPSTLMSLNAPAATEPPPEISDALQLLLAIPLGLVAGAILGVPQWRVLRRYVSRAGWWVLANALAWAAGMPLVFVAAGVRPEGSGLWAVPLGLAAAGAVVGAIHGGFLVRLLGGKS
jgi:hypothetical protein